MAPPRRLLELLWRTSKLSSGPSVAIMFAQIVQFQLKDNCSRETFLTLAEEMVGWLRQQPGFVAYELYEGTESWTDRIAWDSKASAESGLNAFLATDVARKMLPLVESGYSSFLGCALVTGSAGPT